MNKIFILFYLLMGAVTGNRLFYLAALLGCAALMFRRMA